MHVSIICEEMALQGWSKGLSSPYFKNDVPEEGSDQGDAIPSSGSTGELSVDRQVGYSVRCGESCAVPCPDQQGDWAGFKRSARYLLEKPRKIWKFGGEFLQVVDVFADSDWAGCRVSRKSTSGGVVAVGRCLLQSWSSTLHSVIYLSTLSTLFFSSLSLSSPLFSSLLLSSLSLLSSLASSLSTLSLSSLSLSLSLCVSLPVKCLVTKVVQGHVNATQGSRSGVWRSTTALSLWMWCRSGLGPTAGGTQPSGLAWTHKRPCNRTHAKGLPTHGTQRVVAVQFGQPRDADCLRGLSD